MHTATCLDYHFTQYLKPANKERTKNHPLPLLEFEPTKSIISLAVMREEGEGG